MNKQLEDMKSHKSNLEKAMNSNIDYNIQKALDGLSPSRVPQTIL